MGGNLNITITSDVDTATFEKLEDQLRNLLEEEGLEGMIEDFRTGNITRTRKEVIKNKRILSGEKRKSEVI